MNLKKSSPDMWIWISLAGFFFLTTCIFGYSTWNLYRQNVFYEDYFEQLSDMVRELYNQLQRMDKTGAYQSDDEVGHFYNTLRSMMKELFKYGFYTEERVEEDFPSNS